MLCATALLLSCGRTELDPRCPPYPPGAEPEVGYGARCGPGIGRCRETADAFSRHGYTCFPDGPSGRCHIACDIREPNLDAAKNGTGPDGCPLPFVDSRCKSLPGYRCLAFATTPPERRFCVRECSCEEKLTGCATFAKPLRPDGKTLADAAVDIARGQICQDYGIPVCAWPTEPPCSGEP